MVDGVWSWDGEVGREKRTDQDRIYWREVFSVWSNQSISFNETKVINTAHLFITAKSSKQQSTYHQEIGHSYMNRNSISDAALSMVWSRQPSLTRRSFQYPGGENMNNTCLLKTFYHISALMHIASIYSLTLIIIPRLRKQLVNMAHLCLITSWQWLTLTGPLLFRSARQLCLRTSVWFL